MKFKIDENLPSELAERLREIGEEADTVVDEGLAGAPDSRIVNEVRREGRYERYVRRWDGRPTLTSGQPGKRNSLGSSYKVMCYHHVADRST